jgi:hypothetical protein
MLSTRYSISNSEFEDNDLMKCSVQDNALEATNTAVA